jgi:glycosyltransferase involved in cell wall biosynthesis
MKIAVTLDQLARPHPGGIGTYARGLVAGLAELVADGELDANLVGVAPRMRDDGTLERSSERRVEIASTGVGVRVTTRLWERVALGVPKDASVVHATSLAGPFFGGAQGAVHSVAVQDLLWREHRELTTPAGGRFHERRLRAIRERHTLRVIVTSGALADRLVSEGVAPARVVVVRLGVDPPHAGATAAEAFERLGIGDLASCPYTLAVGTIQPRKNYERLVAAHHIAVSRNKDLGPLVIAGAPGWGNVELGDAINVGPVRRAELAALVAGCRVAAYVPIEEGWGLPPIEALSAGRPVATSPVPSVEGNGEVDLADATDVESIAGALLAALSRSDDERARGQRRSSVAQLTWANSARDHLAAWR